MILFCIVQKYISFASIDSKIEKTKKHWHLYFLLRCLSIIHNFLDFCYLNKKLKKEKLRKRKNTLQLTKLILQLHNRSLNFQY